MDAPAIGSSTGSVSNRPAYTAVDKAESDEKTARAINADAVATMVAAVHEIVANLIHV